MQEFEEHLPFDVNSPITVTEFGDPPFFDIASSAAVTFFSKNIKCTAISFCICYCRLRCMHLYSHSKASSMPIV